MTLKINKILIVFFFLLISLSPAVKAEDGNFPKPYLFSIQTCPHCKDEKKFLNSLEEKYSGFKYEELGLEKPRNSDLFRGVGKDLNVDLGGVPFLVICDEYIVGYGDDGTTGKQIEDTILKYQGKECNLPETLANYESASNSPEVPVTTTDPGSSQSEENNPGDRVINMPLFGIVNLSKMSLPVLTIVMGLADGFNPCAMWTLLFLISLLLGFKDKKKMWILGGTFIFVSSLSYFVFMAAWLNMFLLIGYAFWVRTAIAILAIIVGIYFLRGYWKNRDGGCEVMGDEKRQKMFERIKKYALNKNMAIAVGGMALLAFAVNIVELMCSAGLPAIYTNVLSMSSLNTPAYYGYLLLYTFVYMVDDLFVFITAMITLQATGIQNKYAGYSHLIGGVLILIIGLVLLLKPEALMFG